MKYLILCLGLLGWTARAGLYHFDWTPASPADGNVPDGSFVGWADTRILSGITDNSILDVDVNLQIDGGWNGDLYAYLTHGSGISILLNRPGLTASDHFGFGDPGMNLIFDDNAANGDIHTYAFHPGSISDGSAWAPDGRAVDPLLVRDIDFRTAFLSSFNTLNPNGAWTLYVADLSSGETSRVSAWGLTIETESVTTASVPETASSGTILFATIAAFVVFNHKRNAL